MIVAVFALLGCFAVIGYLLWSHAVDRRAWDVERGRYVAALLAKQSMGDQVASTVVRPRTPQERPVPQPVRPTQLDM